MPALPSAAMANTPPAAPVLVSPAGGATMSGSIPQLFTIQATDPDGDPFGGTITVNDASGQLFVTFSTAMALSGQQSSGTPSVPLPPGSYSWSASAADVFGHSGPRSASRTLTVSGAPDLGAGSLAGAVAFAHPIPAPGQDCISNTFNLAGESVSAVVSFAQAQFTGPVNLVGSGGSSCDSSATAAGWLQLAAHGTGVTGTQVDCPNLSGNYLRLGTEVMTTLIGLCTLNGTETDSISFDAEVEFVPNNPGGQVTAATFAGAFAVAPTT
jgi:hypothetical protein